MLPDALLVYLAAMALVVWVVWTCDAGNPTARYRARSWPGSLTCLTAAAVGFAALVGG